jgi:hypothetical protein
MHWCHGEREPGCDLCAFYQNWTEINGLALQAKADFIRQFFQSLPMIRAMIREVGEFSGDANLGGRAASAGQARRGEYAEPYNIAS